jgi:hypothetical protein
VAPERDARPGPSGGTGGLADAVDLWLGHDVVDARRYIPYWMKPNGAAGAIHLAAAWRDAEKSIAA